MKKILAALLFIFVSMIAYARWKHIVTYETTCGVIVTAYYATVQSDARLEADAHVYNQIYCGNPGGQVTIN